MSEWDDVQQGFHDGLWPNCPVTRAPIRSLARRACSLVTDDESGINIGYADKIGGPLVAPPLRAERP